MKISRLYCDCYYTCTEKCTLASRIDSIAHRQRVDSALKHALKCMVLGTI